jgi:DNA-binding MarR family transcriptional regulator
VLESVLTLMWLGRVMERVDSGLSPQQYRILKLAGAGGERSARLAERLAVAKPTLTAIADSLVAAGLARRVAEPGDRRVVRLQLTEAGSVAVRHADAIYGEWLAGLLEQTGRAPEIHDDLQQLRAALEARRQTRPGAAGAAPSPAAR